MKWLCTFVGHKIEFGPLQRSPNTSYTHWRDITCPRCGESLGFKKEYHDALTEPELFQR
jgi:hypothetical protein